MLRHNQSNPSRWPTGCLSTRCVHIHWPGSTNGLFVLHFLTAAHRQECLRGEQWRLAAPPPNPVLLASCPSRAGTQPGVSCRSQMGQRSSGGWLAEPEKQSRPTTGPPSWKITTKEPKSVASLHNFIWHTDISYHVRAGRRPRLSAIPHE